MNLSTVMIRILARALAGTAVVVAASVGAGQTPAAPGGKAAAAPGVTNALIAQSAFVMPRNAAEGRDPFFPTSTRPYASAIIIPASTNAPAPMVVDFRLKGFSGPPEKRLAIINNHTFETGEEAELPMGASRVKVRCVEIRADSVVIQYGGERRELKLRAGV